MSLVTGVPRTAQRSGVVREVGLRRGSAPNEVRTDGCAVRGTRRWVVTAGLRGALRRAAAEYLTQRRKGAKVGRKRFFASLGAFAPLREHLSYVVAVTVLLLCVQSATAGTERYGRVAVTVEEDTGGASGFGYRVYPVTIANGTAEPHTVAVRVPAQSWGGGGSDHLSAVTRTFRVEAGATVRGELIGPAMDVPGENAAVSIDGRAQRDVVPVSVNAGHAYGSSGVAAVRVSRDLSVAQRGELDQAKQRHDDHGGGSKYGGSYTATRSGMDLPLQNAKPIAEWRGNWLTYAGLAEVVVTERDLRLMSAETADALRGYVLGGGRLTVVCTSRWPAVPGWPPTDPVEDAGRPGIGARADVGLGELCWWHADDLAAASDLVIDGWVNDATRWAQQRQSRLSAEQADKSFSVIEGQQTPVRGLLALMVVFALLIGPVNILALSLLKKRMWLLWTVPLGSAVFSGAVIAYAFLSEGITPTARTTSVTMLDQTTREAVTRTLRGYYAPLTPGDGLHFGMDTAVTPQVELNTGYTYGGSGRGRAVDTTHDQHLTRGWVAARVPAHLGLTTVERRRERLDFERLDDGGLAVVNGLGVDVAALNVRDGAGQRYRAAALPAGKRGVLVAVDDVEVPKFNGMREQIRGGNWWVTTARDPDGWPLEPGSYVARTATTPFVADGLTGIGDHRTEAAVVGRWEETR